MVRCVDQRCRDALLAAARQTRPASRSPPPGRPSGASPRPARPPRRCGPKTRTAGSGGTCAARRSTRSERSPQRRSARPASGSRSLPTLSHHSLVQYRLPSTGEIVPLLQIAPSKTDAELLLLGNPELADVPSAIVSRVRDRNGAIPLVAATTAANAPGRRRGRGCSSAATASNTARYRAGHPRHAHRRARPHRADRPRHRRPLRFTPHDFRRLFITDAILGGLPPHVAQVIAGHRDINSPSVTMPSTPTKRSRPTWPSSPAGELRPGEEYRVPSRLGRHNLFGVATGAAEVRTAASTDSSIG